MSNIREPFNFSKYDRTYNNAIDMVAQAVGWARKTHKPLACCRLKPSQFDLFRKGLEVLAQSNGVVLQLEGTEVLEFDGVKVEKGNQHETIILEYYTMAPVHE